FETFDALGHVHAEDEGLAAVRGAQPFEDLDRRRFSRAVGPRRPKTSPGRTSKSMPSTARMSPYCLTSPRTRMTGSVAIGVGVDMSDVMVTGWCAGRQVP